MTQPLAHVFPSTLWEDSPPPCACPLCPSPGRRAQPPLQGPFQCPCCCFRVVSDSCARVTQKRNVIWMETGKQAFGGHTCYTQVTCAHRLSTCTHVTCAHIWRAHMLHTCNHLEKREPGLKPGGCFPAGSFPPASSLLLILLISLPLHL